MNRPVAIEVRDLHKSFRVPGRRAPATLRARLRNPTGRTGGRTLDVLRGLSFDIGQGEFFGIVGRNGSGKSTLLKLLASVYGADRGSIRVAGRLAPFLELGVGFNPELPALDNVVLNGVMMGLTPEVARSRFDEIVEFAGLEDYTDLQVKNYSSGMKVRLGFAVMTHVDADVLLIDEVLAVGDAEFQEKCGEVFERMHAEGRTILLVTHSMEVVTSYCERAMLLDDGRIDLLGDADRVADRYYEVNLKAALERPGNDLPDMATRLFEAITDPSVGIVDAWVADAAGERCDVVEGGERIELRAQVKIDRELSDPVFQFRIVSQEGRVLFVGDDAPLTESGSVPAETTLDVSASIENRLPPGRYSIGCYVYQGSTGPAGPRKIVRLTVTGKPQEGEIVLEHQVSVSGQSVAGGPER